MIKLNTNPNVEKRALERHRFFLALSDTERFHITCNLINKTSIFSSFKKKPQGKGLIITKKNGFTR